MMIDEPILIGWCEWVSLPQLDITRMKAKIDTGARTSVLHASPIRRFEKNNKEKVSFVLHPSKKQPNRRIHCIADLIDQRWITDSGGHREQRCTIKTLLILGKQSRIIELTLTSRSTMRFKILLGRSALKELFIIDPGSSYLHSKKNKQ